MRTSGSPCPTGDEGALARELVARLPPDDPILEADRRQAARVLAERARIASESFRQKGADWDEMRALDLPAQAVEDALLSLVPPGPDGRLLDIGTGTGRVLELLAPRVREALGVDASKAMLALARARLSGLDFAHCAVRLADMYRLPLADPSFDTVVLQMVLHHAEDPAGAVLEAARVLRPRRPTARDRPRRARPCRRHRQTGASLARLLRSDHERNVYRGRDRPARSNDHSRVRCRSASGPPPATARSHRRLHARTRALKATR